MTRDGPVLIMAGGTGGHIFPGLAVARELGTRGIAVSWLGSMHGLENRLVPAAGIPLERIAVSGLRGKGALAMLAAPWHLLRAVYQAGAVLRRVRPRLVLAFGGFASGPGGVAAWLTRRPLIVHEQNRIPGFTNRVLAHFARRVLSGFPDAFASPRVEAVGNPVRAEIAALPEPDARASVADRPVRVLILGGSQGARALNRSVPAALGAIANTFPLEVRHQAGPKLHADAVAAYAGFPAAARVEPFIEDMAQAYGWADLVVCRAGALTLAELCAAGVASVLVPFPHAVDDHQTRNAEYLASQGAAVLLAEGDALERELASTLTRLFTDRGQLLTMARAARKLARPDAAARIAEICLAEAPA